LASNTSVNVDQRLAKAMSHPLRVRILAYLDERVGSPNEISKALGERLANVSYHVKVLLDWGCLELVDTAQRRGATEHYYRSIARPLITDQDWRKLPRPVKEGISGAVLQMVWDDIAAAVKSGRFDAREERHLSRTPLVLDEAGWAELTEVLADTLDRVFDVQAHSSARMVESGEGGTAAKVMLLSFESAPPNQPGRGKGRARRSKPRSRATTKR